MSEIYIGKRFSSYDEFQRQLQRYSAQNSTVFWKRDCRNLNSVKKKVKKAALANPNLRYYFVRVCCVRGGRTFKKKKGAIGQRLRTSKREDCPAFISLSVSNDGQYLVISAMNLNHTHDNTIVENKRRRRRKPIQKKETVCDEQEKQCNSTNNNEQILNNDNLCIIEQCNENLENSKTEAPVNANRSVPRTRPPLTQHQRYLQASHLTAEITVLISELHELKFKHRVAQLEDLIRFWRKGLEVTIAPIEKISLSESSPSSAVPVPQQVQIESIVEVEPSSTSSTNELDQLYNVQSSDNVIYLVVDSPNDITPTNVLEIEKALKNNFQLSNDNSMEQIQHEDRLIKVESEEYLLPTPCPSNVSNQQHSFKLEKEFKNIVPYNENSAESNQSDVGLEYYEVTINDCNEFADVNSPTSANLSNGSKKVLLPVSQNSRTVNSDPVIHRVSTKRRLDNDFDSIQISLPKNNL